MRKSQIVLICAACLLFVTSAVTAQKAKNAMTNADVIQMVGAALSEQVITTSIRQAPAKDFDLTPTGLIALKKAGVSDSVILVMQEVSASAKSTSAGGDKMPADDREQTVNAVLRQQVISQSRGALTLSSFRKTNGYKQDVTKMYVLEWQAEILFQQAGYKAGNAFIGYWEDFRVLQQQPSTLDSLVVGNTIHFNKGARIRLTGDSTFRKTEQGWRLERLKTGTAQVVAVSGPVDPPPPSAGSTAAASSDGSPVAAKATIATGARSLAGLENDIEAGKEVSFPIKYNSMAPDGPRYTAIYACCGNNAVYMADGVVTLSKTAFAFRGTVGANSFNVSPDRILELANQPAQSSRLHVKVAIKNRKGDKEDKKDFYFYNVGARGVGEGTIGGPGASIICRGCDDSMNVLYALLLKVRGKS